MNVVVQMSLQHPDFISFEKYPVVRTVRHRVALDSIFQGPPPHSVSHNLINSNTEGAVGSSAFLKVCALLVLSGQHFGNYTIIAINVHVLLGN